MSESPLVVDTCERLLLKDIACDERLLTAKSGRSQPADFDPKPVGVNRSPPRGVARMCHTTLGAIA